MKIALCDDDKTELRHLGTLLDHYQKMRSFPLEYQKYDNSFALAATAPKERYDLYLLDILMPSMTGMELAQTIRQFDRTAAIIFLTTSPDFAVESYTVKAANYLIKPIGMDAFCAAMDDVIKTQTRQQDPFLVLKSRIGVHKIRLSELIYVEAQNRKVVYHTSNGEQIVCADLFTCVCDNLLRHPAFIQAHRSFLVNMNYIRSIGTADMQLQNGRRIPLAQRRVADIKKHYLAFQMEE